ncbi:MAG: PEP/pyruvate-binding domain-containing protein [Thermodesulfobacteriota bacterium]
MAYFYPPGGPLAVAIHPKTRAGAPLLGGKGANLVRLARAGFSVPPGVILTTRLLVRAQKNPAAARGLVARVLSRALSGFPENTRFAVRSSAVSEDGAAASFAGQFVTVLGVRGIPELTEAVFACWASAEAENVDAYIGSRAAGSSRDMAVVVQEMVPAVCAGVLFTRHPVRPDLDRIVVEAVPGLGESLVSGQRTPDRVLYSRSGAMLARDFLPENREVFRHLEEVPFAAVSRRLEAIFGSAQDAEWAYDGSRLWLLQTRPVTTIASPREAWTRTWGDEFWAEAVTPLQYTFLGRWILEDYFAAMTRINGWHFLDGIEPLRRIKSHVYFNCDYARRLLTLVPPGLRNERFFFWLPPWWRAELSSWPHRPLGFAGNLVLAPLRDRNAGMLSHHRKLRAYEARVAAFYAERSEDDLAPLSDQGLWQRLTVNYEMGREHFRFIRWGLASYLLPSKIAVAWITENWAGLQGEEDPQGLFLEMLLTDSRNNRTMQVNREMEELARLASRVPELAGGERPRTLEEVSRMAGSGEFLAAFRSFLRRHGHRGVSRELCQPRWREDPSLVLSTVLAMANAGPEERPAREEGRDLEQAWLARISAGRLGFLKRSLAQRALRLARAYALYRENQRYVLDYILCDMRRTLLAIAERLGNKGSIGDPEDLFFLTFDELSDLWLGRRSAPPDLARRRQEFEEDRRNLPPEWIFDGREYPGEAEQDRGFAQAGQGLRGTGASPGRAEGRARVVLRPEDLGLLAPGEVLVAPNTDSGWTPVFAVAAAVVVQTGGMLSHAAVVAREYGIPAVTGVFGACEKLSTGDRVLVDGDRGLVERLG